MAELITISERSAQLSGTAIGALRITLYRLVSSWRRRHNGKQYNLLTCLVAFQLLGL